MSLDLDYTGHPFFDVGLATLTAFARKRHPRDLTAADLEAAARWMAAHYVVDPLKSFLTVAFPNSGFTQPAFNKTPEKRRLYAQRVLFAALDAPLSPERDPLTGRPAAAVPYDVKGELPPGRAFRQHVPLLSGEGYINFHPYGDPGVPLSGEAMLAFQALPLGCAKVSGRLLAVHSDDPQVLLHFARTFLTTNRRHVQLAASAGERKLPDTSPHRAKTTLVQHLMDALRERARRARDTQDAPPTVTGYLFTNSGQGAELVILPLPSEVTDFLQTALTPPYRAAWEQLVARAWQITQAKRGQDQAPPPRYNRLYEDLFALPQGAPAFIRRYFLRRRSFTKDKSDPTTTYDPLREADLFSWPLTERFLRKVMLMDAERIRHIRELGDTLAEYIVAENDKRFFRDFLSAKRYDYLRMALIKASHAEVRRGRPPLITLERFLAVFEEAEGAPAADWRLGRDLVLIRLFEQLYAKGWLRQHAPDLDLPEEEEAAADETA